MPPALTICSISSAMISTRPTAGPTSALMACGNGGERQRDQHHEAQHRHRMRHFHTEGSRTTQYRMTDCPSASTATGR